MGYQRVIRYSTMPARPQAAVDVTPFHRFEFPDGSVWTEFYRCGRNYLLRFPGLADFEVSGDGTRVVAYPTKTSDTATVEHLYVNQVLPLALSRQGQPSFHASVVTITDGAVAFLGKTGMGKSTLAAFFALEEDAFLTDDSLVIKETRDGCLALPSHPSLRLWDDSVDALIDDGTARAATITYSTKARLLAGEALSHREEPALLIAAFLLVRDDANAVSISELAGAERHMAWVANSFLLDVEDQFLLAQHFDWTHRIAETVPTFALNCPHNYGMLPVVREAVRNQVADL